MGRIQLFFPRGLSFGWQRTRQLSSSTKACSSDAGGLAPPAPASLKAAEAAATVYEDDDIAICDQSLPLPVWECLQQLRAAGHTVLLVGGAVRDLLLGSQPKDYDLLTSAQLHQLKELFHRPRIFGRNFPICQLELADNIRVEISSMHTRRRTTHPASAAGAAHPGSSYSCTSLPPDAAQILRLGPAAAAAAGADGSVTAGRHRRNRPVMPQFHYHHQQHQHPQPQQQHHLQQMQQQPLGQQVLQHNRDQQQQPRQASWAAARRVNATSRDFTVNGLMYDPFQRLLFDYVCGVPDLQARLLRCIGDPGQLFKRDPACLLRAVRCAARSGLSIEASTLSAMQQHSSLIAGLNDQRLTAELMALMAYGAAAPSMQQLAASQLLQQLLPLHHDYLQRHQCSARNTDSIGSTSNGNRQQQGTSMMQQHLSEDQQQQLQQEPASSALGQLLCQLQSVEQQEHESRATPRIQQQQEGVMQAAQQAATQQEAARWRQQQQQVDCSNLLLRVLTCLDDHVSVQQPAAAEVVLACLVAPLLVDVLADAASQLQLIAQAQPAVQQQWEPLPQQLEHVVQQQLLPPSLKHFEHENMFLGLTLQQAAQHAARHFSSSSGSRDSSSGIASSSIGTSSSQGSSSCKLLDLESSRCTLANSQLVPVPPLGNVAAQLLQGVAFESVLQEQALLLATQVCCRFGNQEQQLEAPTAFGTLFGVHAPRMAAELLVEHLNLSRQQCQLLPSTCPPPKQAVHKLQQQDPNRRQLRSSSSSKSKSSSKRDRGQSRAPCSSSHDLDCFDEYALALPRTNKQYKKLMQQQLECHLQAAHAGYVGMTSDAMLLAAADAATSSDDEVGNCTVGSSSQAMLHSSDLLHKVLVAAGLDLLAFTPWNRTV